MPNPDRRDMLSAFSEEGVRHLLVGAYALAIHGRVRATGDMDLDQKTGQARYGSKAKVSEAACAVHDYPFSRLLGSTRPSRMA